MAAITIICDKCRDQFADMDNDENNMSIKLSKWNIDLKFKLLDLLYKKCMRLKQMRPKYNVETGKDLPTNIILRELENKNDNQPFLDLNKLAQNLEKYELCKKNESEFIKIFVSDWKGKEICNYTEKQVTEWTKVWMYKDQSIKQKYYFELIAVLSQAVYLCNNYYPRHTQIIPIFISIEYEFNYFDSNRNNKKKGILFEIGTGEGKSVVVMLMAATQNLLFNQRIDIATSQTLLAEREAHETTKYFKMLNLGSNGAEYIDADGQEDSDKYRRKSAYQAPIIYSTPYNYQCDLLHINSGKDDEIDCRDGRSFQVNIVDEVDNAFKDLALQSTQLSSPTPGFRDINSILFLLFQRMKMTIISLGMPFVIENTLYFMPNTDDNNNNDIITQYEQCILSSTSSSTDIGTIIANQIISYYLQNKEAAVTFLKEYNLITNNFNYDALKRKINQIRCNKPKLFLQLISNEFIFNINTLVMSQRKDEQDNISVDFHCFFENGKLIKDNISLDDFNGNVVISGSSFMNWYNLKSLVKADQDSYEKCIKDNVRKNVTNYISEISIPSFVKSVINDRLNTWIDSCWRSLFYITEGKDYIIRNEEVCVVDYNNTGCIQPKMHWSNALHEFVQIKHGLKMSTIGTAANIMTNSFYFNLYQHTYGLTGTLGNDKLIKYYKNCFGVDYVRIPSFRKKANIRYNNIYCNNYSEWIKMILLSTYSKLQLGCAVLIIAEHIQQVENIANQLRVNNKYYNNAMKKCNKYSRNDTSERDSVSVKLDEGYVIVATNLAGRGTDIKLTQKVNRNGGLHVILTFMAPNIRIEKQALGRTARAGNPGSSVIIINKQICQYTINEVPDQNIPKVRDFFAGNSIDRLEQRVNAQARIEKYYRKFLEEFLPDVNNGWYLTTHDKDQIFFKWALVYNTMEQDMDDNELSNKYHQFISGVYSDLGVRSKYENNHMLGKDRMIKISVSKRISYNPYYTLINAICGSGSTASDLFWKSECELGGEYSGIGRYFEAANRIISDDQDISGAIHDISKAMESFGKFYERAKRLNFLTTERECMNKKIGISNSIKIHGNGTLNGQTNFEMKYWKTIIELCQDNIKQLQDAGKKAEVSYERIDSAIWDIDGYYEYKKCTVNYYKSCGMWMQLEFEAKRCFWDRVKGFFMAFIGVLCCVAGAVCCCFGAFNIGTTLIQHGVDAIIEGVTAMITGQCGDFDEWLTDFGTKLGLAVMQAGIWDLCVPILGAVAGVAKTVVNIGKKVIDVGKKLMDNGVFQKIANGKFDLFDIGTLADIGSSFIPGDGGKIVKTTIDIAKTGVKVHNAIESGDIDDIVDAVQSGISIVGNDKVKKVGNNMIKYTKTGSNITKNIIDGNINGIIDDVANTVSDLSNNDKLKKGINTGRTGLKCVTNIANGKDIINELHDNITTSTVNNFGNEKLKTSMDNVAKAVNVGKKSYEAIQSGNINDICTATGIGYGGNLTTEYEHKYNGLNGYFDTDDLKINIDDNVGLEMNHKENGLKNVMMKPLSAISNLDDLKENFVDKAFNGCSDINGFMKNANSLIETSANMNNINVITKQMKMNVMERIKSQIGQNEESKLQLKLIGMILTKQYNNLSDEDQEEKEIKEKCKTSKDFVKRLFTVKIEEIFTENKKLKEGIKSISSLIENRMELDNNNQIWNDFQVQNHVQTQITKFIDLYMYKLKELSGYENQVKEDKDWKIEDDFMDCIYQLISRKISKEMISIIEPTLVNLFKPDETLLNAMDPTNILNKII